MEKLESIIQREIIIHLEYDGWYVVKLIQTNKNGIPDLLCIRDGKCMFVEVKRPRFKARPLQEHRMKELRCHGVAAFVAYTIADLKSIRV